MKLLIFAHLLGLNCLVLFGKINGVSIVVVYLWHYCGIIVGNVKEIIVHAPPK